MKKAAHLELPTKTMNNFIRDLIGIKDLTPKFDPRFPEPTQLTTAENLVIHLIQTYPMACPYCGRRMLKNGFQTVEYPQCGGANATTNP